MYDHYPTGTEMAHLLAEARGRVLALVDELADSQLMGPRLAIVNPFLWEIGHVAWFQERWALRELRGRDPILPHGDTLYDSARVAHDTRWDLDLPSRAGTLRYMQKVLDTVTHALLEISDQELPREVAYYHLLALFHEYMHMEAFLYTLQTLEYAPPPPGALGHGDVDGEDARALSTGLATANDDVRIAGGQHRIGAEEADLWVFDNEKWVHSFDVASFQIARTPVTQAQYRDFVEDRGYSRADLWSPAGRAWKDREKAAHPVYWRKTRSKAWERRIFDRWIPLEEELPVVHVNWFEANAYCSWAGRRLPTEMEWEVASTTGGGAEASGPTAGDPSTPARNRSRYPWGNETPVGRAHLDGHLGLCLPVSAHAHGDAPGGLRQMIGNIWEWTASDFVPYAGFTPDPYREYSQPWFGPDHKVLRGGCWATRSLMIRSIFRNFYPPDRRDVWAGFRTCAKEA